MKKMRKLLAVLMTLAMVMGMSLTSFAANEALIKVNDADNATLSYVQVIEPDTKADTGWKFSSDAIAEDYISALGAKDAQTAIAMLIKYKDSAAKLPTAYASVTAATAAQIDKALINVANGVTFEAMSNPQRVNKAGVYAIKATEVGYTYKTMAAYVGFGEVTEMEETDDGEIEVTYSYPALVDATLTAKKIPTTVIKADNDSDNAVAIGQTVRYTITTQFPYFDPSATTKSFKIYDTISGAEYVNLTGDNITATVTIGGEEVEATFVQNGNTFEVDLSAYIGTVAEDTINANATKAVVVEYDAVVNALTVENEAGSNISGSETDSNKINLYTGQVTLTKTNEDGSVKLAGAGFNVTKGSSTELLTFVKNEDGVYTYDPDGIVTEVVTGTEGTVVVKGLDIGTYSFEEVTAPEGYSINEKPVEATLSVSGEAVAIFEATTSMADTKLSALPSTGGIGTTIFTIGGCAIMIASAYMFFVSRRRDEQ